MMEHAERGEKIVTGVVPIRSLSGRSALIPEGKSSARLTWTIPETFYLRAVGAACLLVAREVIDAMPAGEWFNLSPKEDEGVYFCKQARKLGYRILCDTRLQCGHIDRETGRIVKTSQYQDHAKGGGEYAWMEHQQEGAK